MTLGDWIIVVIIFAILLAALISGNPFVAAVGIALLLFWVFLKILKYLPPPRLPCRLVRNVVFRDQCDGTCPPGQTCVTTATRPYGPFGWLGVQAAACACVATPAGGTGGGSTGTGTGTGGPTTGGSTGGPTGSGSGGGTSGNETP